MAERYQRLFSSEPNLYAEGLPVILVAGALLKDNKTGRLLAQLKFKNISTSANKIKALQIGIRLFDVAGEVINAI